MKYRRRYKKRTYKRAYKKRTFKRKFKRSFGNSDGNVAIKLHTQYDVKWVNAFGYAPFTVNWLNNQVGTSATGVFSNNSEWLNYSARYREYKITGVKM